MKIGIPTVLNSSDPDVLSDMISLDPRIKFVFILKLKIKRNDWLLANTCQTLADIERSTTLPFCLVKRQQ